MTRLVVATGVFVATALTSVSGHNFGTNPPTWNREVSRLVFDRCAYCHRPEGTAFSLMTYQDAQPHAQAMKDAVLARTMPPWGAVKGFGDFRNDQGLTQEQVELVSDWVEGVMLKGNNPNVKPEPPKFDKPPEKGPTNGVVVHGGMRLPRALRLDGVVPERVPDRQSLTVMAMLPNGRIQPLVWLYEYRNRFKHPFLFRKPVDLPAGTVIDGLPPTSTIKLLQVP
jgi:hypothetical protein